MPSIVVSATFADVDAEVTCGSVGWSVLVKRDVSGAVAVVVVVVVVNGAVVVDEVVVVDVCFSCRRSNSLSSSELQTY